MKQSPKSVFQDIDRLNAPIKVFLLNEKQRKGAVGPHWHYYLELLYILKGHLFATCDGANYHLNPGDLILYYPQSTHSMHQDKELYPEEEEVLYFVLMVDLNFLNISGTYHARFSKIFRMAYEENPANIHFRRETLQELPILQLLTGSLEEMRSKTYGYDVLVCSNIATLLTYLMRCLRDTGLDTDAVITAPDEFNASIYSITKYIEQHCAENLRVQELADRCGMSYSYFARLFRETYNQSCKEYIEFIRINKVTDLLLFTNLDLNYISQETGFADCSHLIRTFKKRKGITPKQWRAQQKKNG